MRSFLPSPPTTPTCASLESRIRTAEVLVLASVVATRRWPSHSDRAYWLTRVPGTLPEATSTGLPADGRSNRKISVSTGDRASDAATALSRQPWLFATYRLVDVP